jgi:TonB family protein
VRRSLAAAFFILAGRTALGYVRMSREEGGSVRSILTVTALSVVLAGGGLAAQDQVYKTGEGIKSPVLTKEVKPNYTKAAMDRKVQGTVEVDAVVLKDGTVGDVRVTRSLDDDLDQEAVKATKQWTFRPGTKDGEPVAVRVNIELTFTLRD